MREASIPGLTIQTGRRRIHADVALYGEFDLASVPSFLGEMQKLDGPGLKTVVLDLSGLTFMDSSGLQAFVFASKDCRSRGVTLKLAGCQPTVRKIFEVTGLTAMLDA